MLTLTDIDLQFGHKPIFRNLNLTLHSGHKVALAGKNGSGKTSLLSLVLGTKQPDGGEVSVNKGHRISYLEQEVEALNEIAIDYVLAGDQQLTQVNSAIEDAINNEEHMKLSDLYHQLEEIDGYTANARAAEILNGLGFSQEEMQKPVQQFSGGWRMRLNLARCLFAPTEFMLLDEPTNHLDLEAIFWLQKWLKKFSGTLLLVSHDREFLDEIVTGIALLEQHQCTMFQGNYSSYEKQRAQQLSLQQSSYEKQQKHVTHMMDFVNRFKAKASKAKQAQSRLKAIEKLELIAPAHVNSGFEFNFKPAPPVSSPILTTKKVNVCYGEKTILNQLDLPLPHDARIALLGANGSGKSTLLKLLAKQTDPHQGVIEFNSKLKIGYFAQHQLEYLELSQSPLWHLQQLCKKTTINSSSNQASEGNLRKFLGQFGFRGDDALSSIEKFSGGEKSRLALALIVWQAPNLLILDEPTNHLDIEMREALVFALQDYNGAMLVVSHDRHLLRAVVDEFYLLHEGNFTPFDGDLSDYEQWITQQKQADKRSQKKPKKINKSNDNKNKSNIKQLEKKITQYNTKISELQTQLENPKLYIDSSKSDDYKTLEKKLAETKALLEATETQWLKLEDDS